MSGQENSAGRALRPADFRWLLLLSLAGVLTLPRAARAEDRPSVKAVLEGDPAVIERILPVLRASLDHQGLDLVAVSTPRIDPLDVVRAPVEQTSSGPVAYLWLDLAAKQPTMVLVDARSGLVHVRPLAVHADPDAVETELIRFVVDSSLEAILKGRALGMSREEFERSLTSTPPAARMQPGDRPRRRPRRRGRRAPR